jgi:gluconate 2-dehydrogenase alpha chain
MADIKKPKVDAVLVGMGWTGAIMGMELTEAGLNVVGLERGENRDTNPDFSYPKIADDLAYGIRYKLMQNLSRETVTVRHSPNDEALPYRQLGAFLLGNGVGGAGVHWNGCTYRQNPADLKIRSHMEQRYGKSFFPEDMTSQDWPYTSEELEPFYDRFEYVAGISGKAGNIGGKIIQGGNPFEAARSRDYPLAPLTNNLPAEMFAKAAREVGRHPYPIPAANASSAYTNPYGMQMGPCNFCGFCERFGCYMFAKSSPQVCILPALTRKPNFELRDRSYVTRVILDSTGKKATGVEYVDAQGRTVEQPADLVILSAYQMHNVRLLLLSGIGKPYDPVSNTGTVGRNYAYQKNSGVNVFFGKDVPINAFIGSGSGGMVYDDVNSDNFDHGPAGFIGGAYVSAMVTGARPIQQALLPAGSPKWGSGWKKQLKDNYRHGFSIGTEGSVMSYRQNYLSLDPTYKDGFGHPLLRMTFDWQDNEFKMTKYVTDNLTEVARAMNPKQLFANYTKPGDHFDLRPYQTTHTTGGAVAGETPADSVVNKYLQSWDVSNVFVLGASAFPQNAAYNPTNTVGALTYFAAKAIRETYLKNPGPLVSA